jgi:hypothetical protein
VPFTDAGAATLIGGESELGYLLTDRFELSIGERAAWQVQQPAGAFITTTTFAALTWRAPTSRF